MSSSDYAIPEFRHLRRLLFWHGRSLGYKLSHFIKWYMYKTDIFAFMLLFYNVSSKCSGYTFYTNLFYALIDTCLTNLSILAYVVLD